MDCFQVCASRLDPDYFVRRVLERYHVLEMLTFTPAEKRKRGYLEPENVMPMLEGALTLLSLLLSIRTNLGMLSKHIKICLPDHVQPFHFSRLCIYVCYLYISKFDFALFNRNQ